MKDINAYQIWTAIITPMSEDGSVDYDGLEKILRQQEAANNAITLLGSTGEALNIDDDEKKQILNFAIDLKLNVPLMAGVGGINLHTQKEWIEYLNGLELDCYLLVVPLYAKPDTYGQYGWFKSLMDVSRRPCMLYNVPGRTAKSLDFEALSMLKDHKNLWAIKEASGSEAEFTKYTQTAPSALMMSGDDAMLPKFSKLGAKGVVSVASNVWPEAAHEYAAQCVKGTFNDDVIWGSCIESLFCVSNPVPIKALMHDLGMISSPKVRLPLSEKDLPGLDDLRKADSDIKTWLDRQARSA